MLHAQASRSETCRCDQTDPSASTRESHHVLRQFQRPLRAWDMLAPEAAGAAVASTHTHTGAITQSRALQHQRAYFGSTEGAHIRPGAESGCRRCPSRWSRRPSSCRPSLWTWRARCRHSLALKPLQRTNNVVWCAVCVRAGAMRVLFGRQPLGCRRWHCVDSHAQPQFMSPGSSLRQTRTRCP